MTAQELNERVVECRNGHDEILKTKVKLIEASNAIQKQYELFNKQLKAQERLQNTLIEDSSVYKRQKCDECEDKLNYSCEELKENKKTLTNIKREFFGKRPTALTYLLGNYNTIMLNEDEKTEFKRGYLTFKKNSAIFFLIWCLIILILIRFSNLSMSIQIIFDIIYLFIKIVYYLGIFLQECILKQNGRKIKTWWFIHHGGSVIYLILLFSIFETPFYPSFRINLFFFNLMLSLFQLISYYRYSKKEYVRRALGQDIPHRMASFDSSAIPIINTRNKGESSYLYSFIVIFAIALHLEMLIIGITLINECEWFLHLIVGFIMCFLSLGNFITTIVSVVSHYLLNSNVKKHYMEKTEAETIDLRFESIYIEGNKKVIDTNIDTAKEDENAQIDSNMDEVETSDDEKDVNIKQM
eukprot:TRINITY_DN1864_c0_g1_i1.p1 TRINITY_DN1864_c0_g1~~TRINITY_DN1864_c0_g1_i1.p1  ORF type:complete len:435 (+),score=104.63 TRINITY_DN1864_c0_g1_i1:72-1307(+)